MNAHLVALAILGTGCGRIDFDARRDASGGDALVTADACGFGPFSAPRELSEVDTTFEEEGPWLSEDRLELLFSSDRTGPFQIYRARRSSPTAPFGPPALVALGLPGSLDDPFVTDDGLTLWFDNNNGTQQVMVATRPTTAVEFGAAHLEPELDLGQPAGAPSVTSDELTIIFNSGPTGALVDSNLYVATRARRTDAFGAPVLLSAANSVAADAAPSIAGDGSSFVFLTDRLMMNRYQLMTARLASPTQSSTPQLLGAELEVPMSVDLDPMLTRDGRTLVFGSIRTGGTGGSDLYVADRACL